jgi:uncharacterized protein YukE
MAASTIKANVEEMLSLARAVSGNADTLYQRQENVRKIIGDLGRCFSGKLPSLMLQNSMNIFAKTRAIRDNLKNYYADFLRHAAVSYEDVDQASAGEAKNLAGGVTQSGNMGGTNINNGSETSVAKELNEKYTRKWDDTPAGEIEIDSFNGVPAYVNEKNFEAAKNGTYYNVGFENGEKNCAEYVKRYYRTLYDMNITGLTPNGNPSGLIATPDPKPGDVINTMVGGVSHWAIVKEVRDGKAIVIEQNTVYKSGEGYAMSINNSYSVSGSRFFTLSS